MASVQKVFVHIGPLKTGTTFIQAVLYQNRDALLRNQVVLPRETFGQLVRSVLQLMGRRMHPGSRPEDARQWQFLVDEIAAADAHTGLLSMEFLCMAPPKAITRMVRSLAPAEVHIVFTARDYVKVIPAAWQTTLRNKQASTWERFITSLRDAAGTAVPSSTGLTRLLPRRDDRRADTLGSRFWRQQDPRQSLGPYLDHVPADHVHVVTVPPSGASPTLLWERFSAATGLDPAAYDVDVRRTNTSLGAVECETLRRINQRVSGRIPGDSYSDLVKFFLAREVLELREQSFPLVLPDEDRAWVDERTADAVDFFASSGVNVYGDLGDLSSSPGAASARRPDDVSDSELLPVMEETLASVLLEVTRRQGLLPYDGPRSHEQPLPPPEDLGLTGDPPGPGERHEARARRTAPDPPGVVAMKAARRQQRRALRIAASLDAGHDADTAGGLERERRASKRAERAAAREHARSWARANPGKKGAAKKGAAKKGAAKKGAAKKGAAKKAAQQAANKAAADTLGG
ncbi:MAG: hypothetical protein H0U77_04295 [Nocardioidaceae bacterium]|nr:hypothetical protein [Nocardioidaceae bacterium]